MNDSKLLSEAHCHFILQEAFDGHAAIDLTIDYKDKDLVKDCGAKWNADKKTWQAIGPMVKYIKIADHGWMPEWLAKHVRSFTEKKFPALPKFRRPTKQSIMDKYMVPVDPHRNHPPKDPNQTTLSFFKKS
jgi:hypothetical protein